MSIDLFAGLVVAMRSRMPSLLHEALVGLFRDRPQSLLKVLRAIGTIELPDEVSVRADDSDLSAALPPTFHADLVLVADEPEPRLAAVVEVQLDPDTGKRWSWPAYVCVARARLHCDVLLVVIAPRAHVARWASAPFALGGGSVIRPIVLGPGTVPRIVDVEQAIGSPELAVLSAIIHGKKAGAEDLIGAATQAADLLDGDGPGLYYSLVVKSLSDVARRVLEAMMQVPKDFEYKVSPLRKAFAVGKTQGKAESLLAVLLARGVEVPEHVRARILACEDSEVLDRWLERAVVARSAEEVVA